MVTRLHWIMSAVAGLSVNLHSWGVAGVIWQVWVWDGPDTHTHTQLFNGGADSVMYS